MLPGITISKSARYGLERLDSNEKVFDLIKKMYFETSAFLESKDHCLSDVLQVIPKQHREDGNHEGNLMLFHGTSISRAGLILEEGTFCWIFRH